MFQVFLNVDRHMTCRKQPNLSAKLKHGCHWSFYIENMPNLWKNSRIDFVKNT